MLLTLKQILPISPITGWISMKDEPFALLPPGFSASEAHQDVVAVFFNYGVRQNPLAHERRTSVSGLALPQVTSIV